MDRASPIGHMSGNVGASIRVKFDRGPNMRPEIIECRVVQRLGYQESAGTHVAVVEHRGRELRVQHSLIRGLWRPAE